MAYKVLQGDVREQLKLIPEKSIQTVVTSPPYWGLRDYGTASWEGGDADCDHKDDVALAERLRQKKSMIIAGERCDGSTRTRVHDEVIGQGIQCRSICNKCGAIRIDNQLGLEPTPEEYVANMVEVFQGVKRVLRDDGCVWINLGDSYNGTGAATDACFKGKQGTSAGTFGMRSKNSSLLKPKDLVGIPWMVAFALRADGWWLRSDIIWCLSGGTWVYARTQKGDMPVMVRDLARLNPATVKLWNGEKWTQLLGMNKSERRGDEVTLVLRSGERISSTSTHKFPTNRGLLQVKDIAVGDILETTFLPEPPEVKDSEHINKDAAWLAGLYLAEGSRSDDTIQIAGHVKEEDRWNRCKAIADAYGGYITRTIDGNKMDIRIYGKVLNALIDELVSGKTAKDKSLSPVCWRYSNSFLQSFLDGYLSGDGAWDEQNKRWRLGFTRNYNFERDLRTLSARLGFNLTLNMSNSYIGDKKYSSFRGEIKFETATNEHWNCKHKAEVVDIKKSRCRYVYDLGVADDPHLFALASGILTHNSKPNPMPESVTDRPTKSHEYIFLLSKSSKYFYDAEAIKEPQAEISVRRAFSKNNVDDRKDAGEDVYAISGKAQNKTYEKMRESIESGEEQKRNKRSVWTVSTQPYPGAHFATFSPKLIEPCILAGTSPKACECCGSPWVRVVKKGELKEERTTRDYAIGVIPGRDKSCRMNSEKMEVLPKIFKGWQPSCTCDNEGTGRCKVLDPFAGSGTTLWVAEQNGRDSIGIELNPEYIKLIDRRLDNMQMNLFMAGLVE